MRRGPSRSSANIADRIVRRVARRLAAAASDDDEIDVAPDVLAHVQAEAATLCVPSQGPFAGIRTL